MARIAAPLALVLAAIVVVMIVSNSTGDSGSGGGGGGGGNAGTVEQPKGKPDNKKPKRRTYVVESGDSLSSIAEQFGLTVEEVLALNEDVDPQALVTGQKLTLK